MSLQAHGICQLRVSFASFVANNVLNHFFSQKCLLVLFCIQENYSYFQEVDGVTQQTYINIFYHRHKVFSWHRNNNHKID